MLSESYFTRKRTASRDRKVVLTGVQPAAGVRVRAVSRPSDPAGRTWRTWRDRIIAAQGSADQAVGDNYQDSRRGLWTLHQRETAPRSDGETSRRAWQKKAASWSSRAGPARRIMNRPGGRWSEQRLIYTRRRSSPSKTRFVALESVAVAGPGCRPAQTVRSIAAWAPRPRGKAVTNRHTHADRKQL